MMNVCSSPEISIFSPKNQEVVMVSKIRQWTPPQFCTCLEKKTCLGFDSISSTTTFTTEA